MLKTTRSYRGKGFTNVGLNVGPINCKYKNQRINRWLSNLLVAEEGLEPPTCGL